MNREELKQKLDELKVYPGFYSLEGELLPDRIVLYQNYAKWEVFYFDERGNRDNEKVFFSESEACNYIYEHFKKQKEIEKKYQ
ncbi:MAG: hypothetical protein N2044_05610 [Cyclobacteriaceae bacterium]|nr:hypothetical protein [Cyclobacteriaceae bacterium]MCX7637309.1 hypothetical protein [Cyclobacteriaceae bacterium]MDW8331112.1 hypothetical protein [Cyclobacteriaceae bacterium]